MTGGREPLGTTLSNGLRVLVAPWPGTPRVAVAVHYRVGFRAEPPGRQGFAHLFEHLMFRGSASLPDGRFFDHVYRLAGTANGTTHQDFTDYYQVLPSAGLEQALFAEADRMRAPRFTPRNLAEQLAGIEEEIRQATVERPYGGFPWPLLPGVLYDTFANAHDGYGDVALLRRTTPDDCAEFFEAHYAPGNAVLTIAGDVDPDAAVRLAERHFGDIPARPVRPAPDLREPAPRTDRWAAFGEPGVPATAVALGYRLPDPEADLPGYLAHVVLARLLTRNGPARPCGPRLDASCGFFGMLAAKDPDTLVVAALLSPGTPPERLVAAVDERWAEWADPERIAGPVAEVVRALRAEHHRRYGDLEARCRALGRMEALFGRAGLLDELSGLLARVSPERVARAARALRAAHKAVLVLEPAARRTRPRPASPVADPLAVRRGAADRLGRAAARPVPPLGPQREPRLPERCEAVLAGGLRVVAVRDPRVPLIELRLRLPLGTPGWARPERVDALFAPDRARAAQAARAFGGELGLSVDGQWLDLSRLPPGGAVGYWPRLLARVPPPPDPRGPVPPPAWHRPDRLGDAALRRHWLGGAAAEEPGLAELRRAVLNPAGGCLVAVGDLDPEEFAARAEKALAAWRAPDDGERAPLTLHGTADLLVLPRPGLAEARLTLCAVSPPGAGEAARYLAVTIFGGFARSRLATRMLRHGRVEYDAYAGRDLILDTHRAYVRARVPSGLVPVALGDIRAEMSRLATDPPGPAETAAARDHCAAQLLSAFDSPCLLADLIRQTVSFGQGADWLERLPGLLREVPPAAAAQAVVELYGTRPPGGVIVGDVDADLLSSAADDMRIVTVAPGGPDAATR
nr:MAG: hypothetical protein DIU60_16265 [Actinomycetota bacterium]